MRVDRTGRHAGQPTEVDVPPNGSFQLRVHSVMKQIEGELLPMLAYNGSIPGPTLRVRQGSEIQVVVTNDTDMETTVHWHGLRLVNEYDGVPHETQNPIPPGGTYTHRLTFPDPGFYWYHPHIREDFAQEMGLYGNLVVEPADPSYWPVVDREVVWTLDDVFIEDGKIAPFESMGPTFAAMGRYGNVMLIGGEREQHLEVERGERVRFYFTNTANTRVFRLVIPGMQMKLVGGDGGRYEREEWVSEVVIAPSERVVVDVLVEEAGGFALEHHSPGRVYHLADIEAGQPSTDVSRSTEFHTLRVNPEMVVERARVSEWLDLPPQKTLALVAEMTMPGQGADSRFACPMHPEVISDRPGHCPKCGMALVPATRGAVPPGDADHKSHHHVEENSEGIEWEDTMLEFNRQTTPASIRWSFVDRETGEASPNIDWQFDAGDQVKIRIINEKASDHPMQHPFHIHGQRFLILARDGVQERNLVWKDTVLVRTGQEVDILLDASNPGVWMAHCHIPEHMGSGMMFSFRVVRQ